MFEESFNLIQHTPIIHFKPDTSIRATELKPAFDRYLMNKLNIKSTEKEFKTNNRYKVFVDVEEYKEDDLYKEIFNKRKNKKIKKKKTFLFFGDETKYKFLYLKANVIFRSFDKELLKKIKKYFPSFLSQYNFATRKSKGYGSFTANDRVFYKPANKRVFRIILSYENWDRELNYFYKSLREGINENGFYIKPLIFEYACKEGVNWEKKRIKEFLNNNNIFHKNEFNNVNSCGNHNYKIIRDVFGLSTFQRWMGYNVKITKEGEFKRYPSPLFFKPIKRDDKLYVYFWIKDYEEDIRNKRFIIKCDGKYVDELNVLDINWDRFFDLMLSKKGVYKKSENNIENTLAKIYNSLKEI